MIAIGNKYYYEQSTKKLYRLTEIKPSTSFSKTKFRMQRLDKTIVYKTPEQIEELIENKNKK
jgi:hypothetical protein